ncbi:hypothetical protein N7474_003719 [Penicillium riverlandense]|uniref:uncharacterized protein n=1 Tax=Penicillium riverlandense TaxID=1903569 RepID=UPI002548C70E|nr:uncharacterized protein N7474_003719 [Penicillium riverlandense]KAJ5818128.1 hypothetical protein N7474_003719 [Penicillium riverlandense]
MAMVVKRRDYGFVQKGFSTLPRQKLHTELHNGVAGGDDGAVDRKVPQPTLHIILGRDGVSHVKSLPLI